MRTVLAPRPAPPDASLSWPHSASRSSRPACSATPPRSTATPAPSGGQVVVGGQPDAEPAADLPAARQPEPDGQRRRIAGAGSRRHAGRRARPRHRPARHPPARRSERVPAVQRGDVPPAAPPARPAGPDVHLRPRPDGHVPADPDRVQDRQRPAMIGMLVAGLHHRRPALPVRDRPRSAATSPTLDGALAEKRETLWLQTSEGPVGTIEKTPARRPAAQPWAGRPQGSPPEGEPGLLPLSRAADEAPAAHGR